MAEETELSALGNHRFCLVWVLSMNSGWLMTGLAGYPAVIAFLLLEGNLVVASLTGVGTRIFYR